jgi:hypothetical protein
MIASVTAFRRRCILASVLAAFLSLAASSALIPLFGYDAWPELLLGCVAAILNGIAHALIASRSVGAGSRVFLRWGILMNALRIAVVLCIITAVCFVSPLRVAPFALSLVAGTIVFLTCNAVVMVTAGGGKNT